MTRVRRINISQIEGSSANNTTDDEIRPFGEAAIYIDNNGPTDKPVLSIHDGVRTHIKSKVVGPGVMYGSNADAGDDSGADTIKLIPDATLFDQGSNQYIVVDPTGGEPGHIHLRAGGTQDASTADLYLGGELTNIRVSDTSDDIRIRTSIVGEGVTNYDWTFDINGNLTLPNSSQLRVDEGNLEVGGMTNFNVEASGVVNIYTDTNGETPYQWQFGDAGELIFPGGSAIESQYGGGARLVIDGKGNFVDIRDSGNILIGYNSPGNVQIGNPEGGTFIEILSERVRFFLQAVPASSVGAPGDLSGNIAFDGSYIYYCTQDYVPNSSSVTTLASGPTFAYISSADYAGDLVADFTGTPTGWTYNGVTITSVAVDNAFGPGYLLEAATSFSVLNDNDYALVSPLTPNIWKRVDWSNDTW